MIVPEEQRHVEHGPRTDERPGGSGTIEVVAECLNDPKVVLDRSRQVLRQVLANSTTSWPTLEEWRQILPEWFVDACAPEQSVEENERWLQWWRSLPPGEKAQAANERRWTLPDWLFWMEPSERQWFWWDARVDGSTLRVIVEVPGSPSPIGALKWLLRTSGALRVDEADSASR